MSLLYYETTVYLMLLLFLLLDLYALYVVCTFDFSKCQAGNYVSKRGQRIIAISRNITFLTWNMEWSIWRVSLLLDIMVPQSGSYCKNFAQGSNAFHFSIAISFIKLLRFAGNHLLLVFKDSFSSTMLKEALEVSNVRGYYISENI